MRRNFPDSFNTPFEEIITEISNEEAGGHDDHLGIFLHEPVDLLKELPQIIRESQVILTFAGNKNAKQYAFPESEPRGALLAPYTLIKEILIGLDKPDEKEKTEYRFE